MKRRSLEQKAAQYLPWKRNQVRYIVSYALILLLTAFFLFPLVFMFSNALKQDEFQLLREMSGIGAFLPPCSLLEPSTNQLTSQPRETTCAMGLQNFNDMAARVDFWRAFLNSSLVVSIIVLLGLVVNSSFAYALARMRFLGRNLLLTVVIALIIIPFQAIAIPMMLLTYQMGLANSYTGLILPFIGHAFSVYLFYQFFIALPKEIEEAALIDGANRWQIYFRIVVPLSQPVFATVAILQFLAQWGNLLWSVMIINARQDLSPLPLAMQAFFGQYPRQWGDIMAFTSIATLPTLVLFLLFQRVFVQSAASSAIKG